MLKLSRCVLCTVSMFCLSQAELGVSSLASAAPPPSSGEVIARCADPARRPTSTYEQDDPCSPQWSEKLQEQSQSENETDFLDSFHWGPQEPSEFDLRLRYRPGERRPLWGY